MICNVVSPYKVFCQKWEESERGWGTRPDGYSLHQSEGDLRQFVEGYWSEMPDETPDEYSRPDGTPYWCLVDEKTHKEVSTSENGKRYFGDEHPGGGGKDGWVSLRGGGHGKI